MARYLADTGSAAGVFAACALFVCLMLAAPWSVASPLVVGEDQQYQSLAGHLAWYRDSSGQMSIGDIIDSDRQGLFTDATGHPSFGYTSDSIWLRFTVAYREARQGPWLLGVSPSFLDHVQLFSVQHGQIQDLGIQGDRQPWQQRAMPWRHPLYQLPPSSDQEVTFYVQLESTSSIAANLTLWRSDAFTSHAGQAMLLYGALISTGVLVCALGLLFFSFLKQPLYLYFFLYALSYTFLVAQLEGIIHFVVLPQSALHLEWLQVIFQAFAMLSITMLFSEINDLKQHYPAYNKALISVIRIAAIIGPIPMLFGLYSVSIPFFWIIIAILSLATPVITIFMHSKIGLIAHLYAGAFAVIAIGVLIRLTWVFGLSGPNMLSEGNFPIIILLHIAVMFITLAVKYIQLEKAMQTARESALTSVRQSEKKLEKLVAQRTSELDQVNRHLEQQLSISQQNSIDLKKTHSRLSHALDAEKKAALEQRQFLRIVAHEFRTPLSVIQMSADLIASDPRTPEVHATTNCERIQQASERMAAVINQALREDKLDSAEWRKNAEFIRVSELLQECVNYGEMIASGKRNFFLDCNKDIFIQGDYDLLLTMMNNMVDNAVKYSTDNSSIHIRAEQHPDHSINIQVADQGCGMNKEELRQVLDKYFRADTATGIPGMGLGLYIVDRIVRMHNATLTVSSTPGVGTTFSLLFPPLKQTTEAG